MRSSFRLWLVIGASVGMLACGGSGEDGEWSSFEVPSTAAAPGSDGFLSYSNAPTYTASNVGGVTPGPTSAEAAVVHYFASRIRGDDRYLEVLPAEGERSGRLTRGLEEHAGWTFTSFRLVSRKERQSEGTTWIKVHFEIQLAGGRTDSGEDEVEVREADGRWLVVSVPT